MPRNALILCLLLIAVAGCTATTTPPPGAALRDNLSIFPPPETLRRAEIEVGISVETQSLYNAIWTEFIAGREGVS